MRVRCFGVEEAGWKGCFVGRDEGNWSRRDGELQLHFCLRRRVVQRIQLRQECGCHSAGSYVSIIESGRLYGYGYVYGERPRDEETYFVAVVALDIARHPQISLRDYETAGYVTDVARLSEQRSKGNRLTWKAL